MDSMHYSDILEKDPITFLGLLKDRDNSKKIKEWVNGGSKKYENWFSPPLIQLFYLTGILVDDKQDDFFGSNTIIDEKLACEIFDLLASHTFVNPYDTNYYGENIFTLINSDQYKINKRKNNQLFIDHIKNYYNQIEE